jgi:hypothetical protein
MLFVGLLLTAFLAWHGSKKPLFSPGKVYTQIEMVLLLLIVFLPVVGSVLEIKPLDVPPDMEVQKAMARIIKEVDNAKKHGEVLFMDQRQLLTFGYVKDVPLVVEYEKKVVMDRAMLGDEAYFKPFFADMENHRFALIISDWLTERYTQDREGEIGFGEENDAWVKWVAVPVLRYYVPVVQFKGMGVQILEPRTE